MLALNPVSVRFPYVGKSEPNTDTAKVIDPKCDDAETHNIRGITYSENGNQDKAIATFSKAIDLKPDFAIAYYNRGGAYYLKQEFECAIGDFTKAIELKSDFAAAYNNRAGLYYNKGDYDRAIEDYSKTIELEPELAEAYYNRGEAWLHLGEWENAKSDLMTAKSMGINLLMAFDYLYESVQDFEQTNGVKVPEDIATLFSPEVIAMRKAELEQQMVEQAEQLSAEQLETVIDYMTKLREQEEWEATRELEGDPEIAKSLERAEADVKAGRLKSWDEVRRDV